jgi:hypothetical protein
MVRSTAASPLERRKGGEAGMSNTEKVQERDTTMLKKEI